MLGTLVQPKQSGVEGIAYHRFSMVHETLSLLENWGRVNEVGGTNEHTQNNVEQWSPSLW